MFGNVANPVHFDIGFGKVGPWPAHFAHDSQGLYLFRLARDHRDWNFLGMEVRLPMAQAAQAMQESAGLKNLHFMWGNININFARIAASLPQGTQLSPTCAEQRPPVAAPRRCARYWCQRVARTLRSLVQRS